MQCELWLTSIGVSSEDKQINRLKGLTFCFFPQYPDDTTSFSPIQMSRLPFTVAKHGPEQAVSHERMVTLDREEVGACAEKGIRVQIRPSFSLQGGDPPVLSWFLNPSNYNNKYHKP